MTSLGEVFNPFLGPVINDPDIAFSRARQEEPVFFSPIIQSWVVTRFEDVDEVLRQPRVFSSQDMLGAFPFAPEVAAVIGEDLLTEGAFITMDPPAHTRLRHCAAPGFSPKRVNAMAGEVRAAATQLVDRFVDQHKGDLREELAAPLPLTVIIRMFGIPETDDEQFRLWSKDTVDLPLAPVYGVPIAGQVRMAQSWRAMVGYLTELVARRTLEPGDDFISELIRHRDESDDPLSDRELVFLLPGLIVAGHDTTTSLISNALYHLLREPERWEAVCAEPSLVERAVEETLRFDTPAFSALRVVAKDTTLGGVDIQAGSRVFLSLWSANHDEGRYPVADEFSLDRAVGTTHLAFGRGIHFCLGAPLARLEARVALEVLAERLPSLRLAEKDLEYRWNLIVRSVTHLPATW